MQTEAEEEISAYGAARRLSASHVSGLRSKGHVQQPKQGALDATAVTLGVAATPALFPGVGSAARGSVSARGKFPKVTPGSLLSPFLLGLIARPLGGEDRLEHIALRRWRSALDPCSCTAACFLPWGSRRAAAET